MRPAGIGMLAVCFMMIFCMAYLYPEDLGDMLLPDID
jgi:hypothetical protein